MSVSRTCDCQQLQTYTPFWASLGNLLVRVIHLCVLAHELLLALLISEVPTDLVAVLLGLEERNQMDTRPHLFASKFAAFYVSCHRPSNPPGEYPGTRTTYLASRMPPISLYQPYPINAPIPRSIMPGRKPLAGKLRYITTIVSIFSPFPRFFPFFFLVSARPSACLPCTARARSQPWGAYPAPLCRPVAQKSSIETRSRLVKNAQRELMRQGRRVVLWCRGRSGEQKRGRCSDQSS